MTRYKVTIKEKGVPKPITTHYVGDVTEKFIVDFYGLHKSDVEWYKIEKQ